MAHWVFYVFPSNGLRLVQGVTEISLDNENDFFSYGDIHYEQHGFNVSITDPMNKETTWSRHCGPFWKLIWCKNIWTLKFGYFLSTCICTMLLNVTFWFFLFLLRASPKVFFLSAPKLFLSTDGPGWTQTITRLSFFATKPPNFAKNRQIAAFSQNLKNLRYWEEEEKPSILRGRKNTPTKNRVLNLENIQNLNWVCTCLYGTTVPVVLVFSKPGLSLQSLYRFLVVLM